MMGPLAELRVRLAGQDPAVPADLDLIQRNGLLAEVTIMHQVAG